MLLSVGATALMGSDAPHSHPVHTGNNYSTSLASDGLGSAKQIAEKLSTGDTMVMPAGETFWAEYFAGFADHFGIGLMINYEGNKKNGANAMCDCNGGGGAERGQLGVEILVHN